MPRRNTNPALVIPGVSVETLTRLPRLHSRFDEVFLQGLLADHPELLPADQMRDDIGELIFIGREITVPSGSIDILYLSTQGYPVIVETKLWRNPQARREVLSQTLDYIKDVVAQDYEWFVEQWAKHHKHEGSANDGLLGCLNTKSDDEVDEQFIVDRLNRALARGDVIAMIVGDGIETRLQELVNHLCRDSSHLRYSLALVELACYEMARSERDGLFVVPRIVHDVEPVQRAYVRVDVADGLQGQVKVTPVVVEPTDPAKKPTRVTLSEEDFLNAVEASAGRKVRDQMQAFYNDLVSSFGLELDFKSSAVMLKLPHPIGDGLSVSILALEKQGRIYNTEHLEGQLGRWGIDDSDVKQITSEYWAALHNVDSRFNRIGIDHMALSEFLPFAEVASKLPEIKACVGQVVGTIRSALEQEK